MKEVIKPIHENSPYKLLRHPVHFSLYTYLGTNMSAYPFSDIGGAHPAAKVEARIRVGAPADADDAQGGPSDAAAVGGDGPHE